MKNAELHSVILKAAVIGLLSILYFKNSCFSQPYPPIPADNAYFYQTDPYPNNHVANWGGDDWVPNGLAHTDNYWVIVSIDRDPITKEVGNTDYTLWKIPVSNDLINQSNGNGVTSFNLLGSNVGYTMKRYGHAGDIDVCTAPAEYGGKRYIVVPLTSRYGYPYGGHPIVAFFNASDLQFVNYARLSNSPTDSTQHNVGWCAVSPTNGRLYTSLDDATHLKMYKIQWDTIINQPGNHWGLIRTDGYMGLLDEWGLPLTLTDMQGGEFTEDGELLYLSSGVMDCNSTDGLHVFRQVNNSWKRIKRSGNPLLPSGTGSCFQLPQDCTGSPAAVENEGLTIWNLNSGQAPGISQSSLHVLQVNHSAWTSCSEYIRHYKSKSAGSTLFESMEPVVAENNVEDLMNVLKGKVNGDGKSDLILTYNNSADGLVIKNMKSNGDGTYYSSAPFISGEGNTMLSYPILTGDINGDDTTDLILTYISPTNGLTIRTKFGKGNGTYVTPAPFISGEGGTVLIRPVLTGDVNYDGKTDLIFAYQSPTEGLVIRTKISHGDGTYSIPAPFVSGETSSMLTKPTLTGDVNGDGKSDIIITYYSPDYGLVIRTKFANGNGSYSVPAPFISGDEPNVLYTPVLTGDVNGDGRTDLIFVFYNSSNGLTIRTKMSNGDGTFTPYEHIMGDGNGVIEYPVLTGDVDGDGKTDLFFVGKNWDGCGLNIRVKRSNGDGTWCEKWQVLGDVPEVLLNPTLSNDVNGDGKTDISFTYIPVIIDTDPNTPDLPVRLRISTKISLAQSFSQCHPHEMYYRTRRSGNWNNADTWESSSYVDFSSQVKSPAPLSPDQFNAKSVIIRDGHNILVTESVSSPKIFANPVGSLHVLPGVNLRVVQ